MPSGCDGLFLPRSEPVRLSTADHVALRVVLLSGCTQPAGPGLTRRAVGRPVLSCARPTILDPGSLNRQFPSARHPAEKRGCSADKRSGCHPSLVMLPPFPAATSSD